MTKKVLTHAIKEISFKKNIVECYCGWKGDPSLGWTVHRKETGLTDKSHKKGESQSPWALTNTIVPRVKAKIE